MAGLRSAVREALVATLGEPPARVRRTPLKPDPEYNALVDLGVAFRSVINLPGQIEHLAGLVEDELSTVYLTEAIEVRRRVTAFITALQRRIDNAA